MQQVAQKNLQTAGVRNVRVLIGDANQTITTLYPEPPFDLVFIDADKQSHLKYFLKAKYLTRLDDRQLAG